MLRPLVRPFVEGDEAALADVFRSSVLGFGTHDYSADQVRVWADRCPEPDEFARTAADGRCVFVAVNESGLVVGYSDVEPDGHIDHLYCRPEFIGRGVGSALYAAIERYAVDHGIRRLYVEASESARRLFARRGFHEVRRNDMVLDGVAIHNYVMERTLS